MSKERSAIRRIVRGRRRITRALKADSRDTPEANTIVSYALPDEVLDFHHAYTPKPSNSGEHRHPYYELYLLLSGDVVAWVQNARYALGPYDLLVMNGNESHSFEFLSPSPYERVKILFKPEYVADFQSGGHDLLGILERRRLGSSNHVSGELVRRYGIDRLARRMEAHIREGSPDCELLLECELVQLLVRLNQIYREEPQAGSRCGVVDERITRILDFLHQHAADHLTLDRIADEFHISKYYLCHLFKRSTGFSVLEYVTYRRIVKAKELLAQKRPLADACYETGFSDYSCFYRDFRKAVHMSPKQFAALF